MGVVEQVGLAADVPVGCPLIGYDNKVTSSNVSATTEDDGFPATSLADPATYTKWKSATFVNTLVMLLHFDGSDGAVTVTDSFQGRSFTGAAGFTSAQIDTAQQKFGASSFLFPANSPPDYILAVGSSHFAFGADDFTIDFWVRFNSVTGTAVIYDSRPLATNGAYPTIYRSGTSLRYLVSSVDRITGATVLAINTWYHVALIRKGTSTKLFLDGVQEGSTYTDTNVYLNGASRPSIGGAGDTLQTNGLNGWLDEVRVVRFADWNNLPFTAPVAAHSTAIIQYLTFDISSIAAISYVGVAKHNFFTMQVSVSVEMDDGSGYVELIAPAIPGDNDPIIYRFTPHTANSPVVSSVRLKLSFNLVSGQPEVSVIYIGELLVLERSIKIDARHVPITYGRRTTVLNGMSESGNFMGRVMLNEFRQSKAEFDWFQSDFYRSDIDAFLDAAQEFPFFWAWSPEEYPAEVGYVWLTNNAEPEVDPVTRRIELDLEMRGVA